jgi:uncharacterized membrane protein YhfC
MHFFLYMLVAATFVVVALLEIVIPFALGFIISRKLGVPWKIFVLGALSFIIVQLFHTPLVFALQGPLLEALGFENPALTFAVLGLVLGLLAGLFEEIGRYIVFKWVFPWRDLKLKKKNALMFGVGWGGIESIFVGILVIMTMVTYLSPLTEQQIQELDVTDEQREALIMQQQALQETGPLDILPSLYERVLSIVLHIAFTFLVYFAVVQKKILYLIAAILYHAFANFIAVFVSQVYGILPAYIGLTLVALPGAYYIWKVLQT